MKELTPRQREIYEFFRDNRVERCPYYEDAAKHFNTNVNNIGQFVKSIEKKGYLKRTKHGVEVLK